MAVYAFLVNDVVPSYSAMPYSLQPTRPIGFLVFPQFQILDLTGPLAVFQIANRLAKAQLYDLRVVSLAGGQVESTAGLTVVTDKADDCIFDTVLVSGGEGSCESAREAGHQALVRKMGASTRRMTSVCTGAFLLAGAGLLDGRRATTHWRFTTILQNTHPSVLVEATPIYVKDGPVWSSAGITAGIDLALALVEEDLGIALTRQIAMELVIYQRRPAMQPQVSTMLELEPSSDGINRTLIYAREHLDERLSVKDLADVACLSERQFSRAFHAETGETPARAVERLRVEAASLRLETGREPVELIARSLGFKDPERMRRAFMRIRGDSPRSVRQASQSKKKKQ